MGLILVGLCSALAAFLILIMLIMALFYKKNWDDSLKVNLQFKTGKERDGEILTPSKVFRTASVFFFVLAVLEGGSAILLLRDPEALAVFPPPFPQMIFAIALLLLMLSYFLNRIFKYWRVILWREEIECRTIWKKKIRIAYTEIERVQWHA